jgi:hypothetical protein
MVQREKGEKSECVCPQCFSTCGACLGVEINPLDREGLKRAISERSHFDTPDFLWDLYVKPE